MRGDETLPARILPVALRTLAIAAVLVVALPAAAQKAKDTLRIPYTNPIQSAWTYDDLQWETGLTSQSVFDGLVCADASGETVVFRPLLATSWSRIDDRTLEFKLQEGVTFHDGSEFTADDVVYTLNWFADPKSALRGATDTFSVFERAEKIDKYTIRVSGDLATPLALTRLAGPLTVLPAKLHASYADKADFGRTKPIGTGPYAVKSIEPGRSIELVRNAAYRIGSECNPTASIATVKIVQMPDAQTQIAQLMTGGIDLLRSDHKDTAEQLAGVPDLEQTVSGGLLVAYLQMDVSGRSSNKALANPKVRQAVAQAIDRDLVARTVVAGGDAVRILDAACLPIQRGCVVARKPYPYDPAAARRLLAEAGYPDGFDVELTATTVSRGYGEALAGELRKIGIRAVVDTVTIGGYREKQLAGRIQMLAYYATTGMLDVTQMVKLFSEPGPRDYWRDEAIVKLARAGFAARDPGESDAAYRQLWDRVNELAYMLPISNVPAVIVHSRDLAMHADAMSGYGADLNAMRWR
jgi:peptide/nickel transport system substrate-binding protein